MERLRKERRASVEESYRSSVSDLLNRGGLNRREEFIFNYRLASRGLRRGAGARPGNGLRSTGNALNSPGVIVFALPSAKCFAEPSSLQKRLVNRRYTLVYRAEITWKPVTNSPCPRIARCRHDPADKGNRRRASRRSPRITIPERDDRVQRDRGRIGIRDREWTEA